MTFVVLKATAYLVKICVLTLSATMESYTSVKKPDNFQIDKINIDLQLHYDNGPFIVIFKNVSFSIFQKKTPGLGF